MKNFNQRSVRPAVSPSSLKSKGSKDSKGFTLIELMIAIGLGVVMSLGLVQLFITTRQTYTVNNALGLMMENANAAINTLSTVVSFAGHQGIAGSASAGSLSMGCWVETATPSNFAKQIGTGMTYNQCLTAVSTPCVVAAPGTAAPSVGSPPTCSYSSYVQGSTPYYYGTIYNTFGLQNYNSSTDSGVCWAGPGSAGGPFTNPSVTCSQSATVDYVYLVGGAASQSYNMNAADHNYIAFIPNFSGRTSDPLSDSGKSDTLLVAYSGDNSGLVTDCLGNVLNQYTMVTNYFIIQRDTNNNPYLACAVTSMNTLTNSGWITSPYTKIASGVEAFRVIYGQDTDFDGAPNKYINSTPFSTGTWYGVGLPYAGANLGVNQVNSSIVGVQIALLMRTDNQVTTVQDTKTYTLLAVGGSGGYSHGPFNDNRIRKVYNVTLKSNECLPSIRSDCLGAPFWGGAGASWSSSGPYQGSVSGYIKLSQTVWFSHQPIGTTTYGCAMDASGNLTAVQNPAGGTPTPLPYLKDTWDAATSADGKFSCYFR